jgi:hypothetical protein
MYHLKTDKRMNNASRARPPTSPELFVGNKNSLLLSQLSVNNQVNNQSTWGKSTTTPGNKNPWHQPPLSHDSRAMNLVLIACAPETSRGTLSEMA